MKKWLILFVISIYLYVPLTSIHYNFLWLVIFLTFVSGCFNIVNAVKMQLKPNDETGISMKTIMILKLCLLPVYIVFFLVFVVFVLMLFSMWFTIPVLFTLPGFIAFSYFVLIASSALAISRIILLCRRSSLTIGQCILHVILQLFFVTDVISCIILSIKEHKIKRSDPPQWNNIQSIQSKIDD